MKVLVRFSSLALIMGTLPSIYAYAQDEAVPLDEPTQEVSAADPAPEEILKPEKAQEQELEPTEKTETPAATSQTTTEPAATSPADAATTKPDANVPDVAVTDEQSGEVIESPEEPVEEVDVEPPQENPEDVAKKEATKEEEAKPDNQVFNTASERGETMEALPEEEEIPVEEGVIPTEEEDIPTDEQEMTSSGAEEENFEDKGLSLEATNPDPAKSPAAPQNKEKTAEKESLGHKEGVYSAGTPRSVTVTPKALGFADIYKRQIEYKVEAEKLTAALHERQEAFIRYQTEARENYTADLTDMYKKDSEEYAKKLAQDTKNADNKKIDNSVLSGKIAKKTSPNEPPPIPEDLKNAPEPEIKKTSSTDDKVISDENVSTSGEDVGIKEKHVPPSVNANGQETEGKKVVVPGDAPEFDPSRL